MLAVVNDTDETWSGTVTARRELLDGTILASAELVIGVAPRSVTLLELPDDIRLPGDPAHEVVVAELDGERTVHCFVEDIDLSLDHSPLEATVEVIDDGYLVHVHATSLVKDLALFVDRLDPDAEVDACLVTLPAGTDTTIRVRSDKHGLESHLVSHPVLRSANDLTGNRPNISEGNAA